MVLASMVNWMSKRKWPIIDLMIGRRALKTKVHAYFTHTPAVGDIMIADGMDFFRSVAVVSGINGRN